MDKMDNKKRRDMMEFDYVLMDMDNKIDSIVYP